MPVQIDSPFTPDSSFRPYLIVVTGLGMLIPPTFFFALMGFGILNGEDGGILAVIAGIFVVFAVAGGLWAYLYCRTVSYLLTPPTEMTWGPRGSLETDRHRPPLQSYHERRHHPGPGDAALWHIKSAYPDRRLFGKSACRD
ncbi:hypothetical protein [Methanogenium cariaci]|uniref:hypothetical protein n=1 Tax=Methanogenium cariaci TaxID=2197 RepID=UPI001FDF938F|nr:hypothetical protein [Methanogenium cariaci]